MQAGRGPGVDGRAAGSRDRAA